MSRGGGEQIPRSDKLYDTSRIASVRSTNRSPASTTEGSAATSEKASRRRSLSRPRSRVDYTSHHQYVCRDGELFSVLIYDTEHSKAPYLHAWIANIPGKLFEKGVPVFKFEKIPLGSKNRYNIDFYRQYGELTDLESKKDEFTDSVRSKFPVDPTMKALKNTLVSRQEMTGEEYGVAVLPLSAAAGGGLLVGTMF